MKVEWSDQALADLDRFADFLQRGYPSLAAVVAREIIGKAELLSGHPLLGRALAGREEYRQIVLQVLGAAYVFQYRYDGRRVVMLRVFHSGKRGSNRRHSGARAAQAWNPKPRSRFPGAMQRVALREALLRRTGIVRGAGARYGPGSAMHRSARASALHCVRGTGKSIAI